MTTNKLPALIKLPQSMLRIPWITSSFCRLGKTLNASKFMAERREDIPASVPAAHVTVISTIPICQKLAPRSQQLSLSRQPFKEKSGWAFSWKQCNSKTQQHHKTRGISQPGFSRRSDGTSTGIPPGTRLLNESCLATTQNATKKPCSPQVSSSGQD